MRSAVRSTLLALALATLTPPPLQAAGVYFEGWDAGMTAGWIQNTISCNLAAVAAGGNPGGFVRSTRVNNTFPEMGTQTLTVPEAIGDFAAAGLRVISFDVRNDNAIVQDVRFRVRYLDSSHNGWSFRVANDLPVGVWQSFVIYFDPTWTDAEAIAAGWVSDGLFTVDFASTFASVHSSEIRVSTTRVTGMTPETSDNLSFDNFRLATCDNDMIPPQVEITLDRDTLWPPNHKMAEICATIRTNDCDSEPTVNLVSIDSDEPDNGTGDGDKPNDTEIISDTCFRLRAERAGTGEGRKYTITWDVTDASGNTTTVTACVSVSKSQAGGAMASSGFAPQGNDFLPYMSHFALVIPSSPGVDARQVDPERAMIGNHLGVVSMIDYYRLDVNGDRREDLALLYSIDPTRDLIDRTNRENSLESFIDPNSPGEILLTPRPVAVDFYYETKTGSFLVTDIMNLGRPVKLPPKEGEHGDGGTAEIPRDGLGTGDRPGTGIVTLAQGGRVIVEVFNVQGQKVRTILDQDLDAGTVSVDWDGRDASGRLSPGGIYFTRITAPGVQETRKVRIANR